MAPGADSPRPELSLSKGRGCSNIQRMERFDASRIRLWRLSRWQTWLLVAIAIAIGFAVTVLGAIVVLVLTPLFLLAAVAVRLISRSAGKRETPFSSRPKVIDADYEIVPEESRSDRNVIGSGRTWPPSS